jgi:hypothetical protein
MKILFADKAKPTEKARFDLKVCVHEQLPPFYGS